ncbi:hypothetical protein KIW84_055595 [Lathyrus oleraceus]|uniref:MHD domain-containing protein n=1 Tax=Pisum sativum TaxID=3888 RepID=A0A9D4WX71_PEA|nr:hypothetical protein KIW84_055595 [Pisum sativum]
MALRNLFVLGLLLLVCLSNLMQVSSEHEIEMEEEDEEELQLPNELLTVRDGNRRLMQDIDCGGLCNSRCSVHSRPNLCNRACGTCCVRCKCVPPGTSGNRELCGACYTDMTTLITKSVVTNEPGGRKRDEIFVDVIEKISVTFNSSGYILTSDIDGTIQMKSYLIGNPEIRLALNEDLSIGTSDYGGSGAVI